MEKQGEKIDYLDGLRGLAAVGVMVIHFVVSFYPALFTAKAEQVHLPNGVEVAIAKSLWTVFYPGNLAVPIFFVLSAYVLSYRFFIYKELAIVRSGAYRRYLRLALVVLASMLMSWFLMRFQLNYNDKAAVLTHSESILGACFRHEPSFLGAVYQGLWDCFTIGGSISYNPVLWTMNYEMIASYIVYGFLALFGQSRQRGLVYAVLLVAFIKSYFFAFILGLIFSDMYYSDWGKKGRELFWRNQWLSWLCIGIGYFLGAYFEDKRNPWSVIMDIEGLRTWGMDLYAFYHVWGAAFVFIGCLYNQWMRKVLSHGICRFLGRISFSLYIVHFLLISSLGSYLFLWFLYSGSSYHQSVLFSSMVTLTAVFVASYLMTRYVDEPVVDWVRALQKKYFP